VEPEVIVHKESLDKARLSVVRWLRFRSRSRREVELYMEKKGFAREISAALLDELQEYRYIDDLRFTEEYIQSCLGRGFGQNRARSELTKKGIDRELLINILLALGSGNFSVNTVT
jgi:regulatory protein